MGRGRWAADDGDPAAIRYVQLRYFAGLSAGEAADVIGLSRSITSEHWADARARRCCLSTGD